MSKTAALEARKPGQFVIIIQDSKKWKYTCRTMAEIQALVLDNSTCIHECIEGPCKLFFDIDSDVPCHALPVDFTLTLETQISKLIPVPVKSPIWFSRKTGKLSFHLVYPTVWVSDRRVIIDIAKQICVPEPLKIDPLVYQVGHLRVAYSSKPGQLGSELVNGSFSPDKFTSGFITCESEPIEYTFPQAAPTISTCFNANVLPEYQDAMRNLLDWLVKNWSDFKPGKIRGEESRYSVHNLSLTYCKSSARIHKSNKAYFQFQFQGVYRVKVYIHCTDCKKGSVFPYDLSRIAFPITGLSM